MEYSAQQKLRVAFVINSLGIGGAERAVLDIASHLDRERFESIVYVLRDHTNGRRTLLPEFKKRGVEVVFLKPGSKTKIGAGVRLLIKAFRQKRPDVVHCHLPDSVVAGGVAARLCGIPFIAHEHQTRTHHSAKLQAALGLVTRFAALVIVFTEGVEKEIFGSAYVLTKPPERLMRRSYTIHNGIDIFRVENVRANTNKAAKRSELGIGPGEILVTSVARFIEWKGHRALLEAFARVLQTVPNARLLIAGDGPLRTELWARAAELSLGERVIMPGARDDVYELLSISDIFSLAFTYPAGENGEAIGIAALEAMAFGLPAVVAGYPQAADYIEDGANGVLVRPRDEGALADALARLAGDPKLRSEVGGAAAWYVRANFDLRSIMGVYERIYHLVASL